MNSDFINNLKRKFHRVFTNKGIVIKGYRVSYRIIPVALICLLVLILFFSLLGKLFKGGSSDTPTDQTATTQTSEQTGQTEQTGKTDSGTDTGTAAEGENAEDQTSHVDDGENYYAILNGTKQVAMFTTEKEANDFLNAIKAEFVDPNDKSAKVTIEPELKIEKVLQSENDAANLTKDGRALINTLLYGSNEESTYTTTESDTMWDIAVAHDVSLEELMAANPDVDPNAMHAGMTIKIKMGQGEISVRAVYETTKEEDIPYDTVYEESDELYVGEEEVVTWGRKGRQVTTTKVVKVNGVTVSEDASEVEVLEQPVTEVIRKGTIGDPNAGSDDSDEESSDESNEDTSDSEETTDETSEETTDEEGTEG